MTRLRATFKSLSNYNYRLYFVGQSVSASGTWMQRLGQAWLVLDLTGSGTMLGVTAALQQLPMLMLGPWTGLLADRVDKRRLIVATQAAAAALAIALFILTATESVELWMVLLLAMALGVTDAVDRPVRSAFVVEMVGPERLTNAVVLNSVVMNAARTVGPAIGGIVIATLGLAASFLINSVSYLAVVGVVLAMRTRELRPPVAAAAGPGQVRNVFRHVMAKPELAWPLGLMTVAGLLAFEWTITLPLLARDTFGGDARTLGFLFSAMGIGAVIGGLWAAASLAATETSLLRTAWRFSVLLVAVALAPGLPVALLALFLLGAASIAMRGVAMSLLQLNADPDMRGRVMALFAMALAGTTPVGGPLVGWIGETFGARTAFALAGIGTGLATWALHLGVRRARRRASPPVADVAVDQAG
ncbi:MAG TPA: MFS transporter [Acidimicrobiia bacterium]